MYEFSSKGTIVDFNIQSAGTNYTETPTVAIENTGDIQATATVNMTTAGDQVESLTITNGGYGIPQTVDGTYNIHPTVTFTNAGWRYNRFWCCCTSNSWWRKNRW